MSYGVAIGRFQVPRLHEGHIHLLDYIKSKHDKLVILVGVSPLNCSYKDPLSYASRESMIREKYPDAVILPIYNSRSDKEWSYQVDRELRHALGVFCEPVLYGGRDSFIPYYSGQFTTEVVPSDFEMSATNIRRVIGKEVRNQESFREGVIWAVENQYPGPIPTVDVAIFGDKWTSILLAKKLNEDKHRFIGGFCNNDSLSYEADARREVQEEAGIEITDPIYLCNMKINDWRYRWDRNQIHTTFFAAKRMFGNIRAGDDVNSVRWFPMENSLAQFLLYFVEEHIPLAHFLYAWWNYKKNNGGFDGPIA